MWLRTNIDIPNTKPSREVQVVEGITLFENNKISSFLVEKEGHVVLSWIWENPLLAAMTNFNGLR